MTDEDEKRILAAVLKALAEKERDKTPYWTVERIIHLVTLLAALAAGYFGVRNNSKIETVEAGQHAAVAVAEDVKLKLDDTTKDQKKQLDKVQKATEAVEDSQGPQLWLTWKRLEEDATYARDNGLTEDAKAFDAKAKDAKAKFDAHATRQRNGKN